MLIKKLKTEPPYAPTIPLVGIYPKKMKTLIKKRYMHPYVHCDIIYNSQDQDIESILVSTDRGMNKKMCYRHIIEYYSAIKNEILDEARG